MQIIKIEDKYKDLFIKLESCYYLHESQKVFLSYMINNNVTMSESFQNFYNEYLNTYKEYVKLKQLLFTQVIQPYNFPSTAIWQADFDNNEVIVND